MKLALLCSLLVVANADSGGGLQGSGGGVQPTGSGGVQPSSSDCGGGSGGSGFGGSGGSGFGGSGFLTGSGSGGAGCVQMIVEFSACDDYDYDQAACEEHHISGCIWDDLNGCDVEVVVPFTEPESGCVHDYTANGAADCDAGWDEFGVNCATLGSTYGWDCSGCSCPGDEEGENGDQESEDCQGDDCGDDQESEDCEGDDCGDQESEECEGDDCGDDQEPEQVCDNACPSDFADTEVCANTDWENATEEDLCTCAKSIASKMGADMPDCGYPSPFGDGCRTTGETIKRCSPEEPEKEEPEKEQSTSALQCNEHADNTDCLEQCGCRWAASICINDIAREAIAALGASICVACGAMGMDQTHVESLSNLAKNEEFVEMADEDFDLDLEDITALELAYVMYHWSDSDKLVDSIVNLETMDMKGKMAAGKFFQELNEAMSEDNKGFCECEVFLEDGTCDDDGSGALAAVATGVAVAAALGAILM